MFDSMKHFVATETEGLPDIGDDWAWAVNCKALTAAWGSSNPVPMKKDKSYCKKLLGTCIITYWRAMIN